MTSISSAKGVSSENAVKTRSLMKRKHTALDFLNGPKDALPSSDSRALRPLPRRGRSRNIAAPREGLTDVAATAASPTEVRLGRDGKPGAARSEGEGPVLDKTFVSRDDSNSAAAPPSKRLRLSSTSSDSSGRAGCANALHPPPPDDDSPAPTTAVLSCGNCGSILKPARVYNSKLLRCKVCPACWSYERKHSVSRPQSLFRPVDEPPAPECANCGRIGSPKYRRSKLVVGKLCVPCYEYERRRSKRRPINLVQRMQARDQRSVVKCGNCQTNVTYGTWYNSVLQPGSKTCGLCRKYERKTGQCRPPRIYQRPPQKPPLRCYNCGEIGELACNECSIHFVVHGFARPLSKDAIKKRRARALREERVRNPHAVSNVPSTSVAAPSPSRQCSNCQTKTTSDWCRSRLVSEWDLCRACARYEKRYGRHRPLSLEIQRSLKLTK